MAAPSRTSRIPRSLLLFTTAYMAPAGVAAVSTGNQEFLFYIAVMLLLIAVVAVVHVRVGLSSGVLWGLAHMVGGLVPVPAGWPINGDIRVVYSLWILPGYLKYDHLVHAWGFGATTFLCWEGMRSAIGGRPGCTAIQPTTGMIILCAAASMGFGAANEIVEFMATLLVPETNVGGYINTGWDLVANAVGASLAALSLKAIYASSP